MKTILTGAYFVISSLCFAQTGQITVVSDDRIDDLVIQESEIQSPAVNPQIDGFRIQLFFDSERSAINDARRAFITRHPRIDTYTIPSLPNFSLHAGDFRTQIEAEKVRDSLKDIFPTSFIVKSKINLPRLEKEKSN